MVGIETSPQGQWTRRNSVLTLCSALTLVGAIEVFLFGVVWTHGVYGSRIAWLGGVVLPLLAIAAGLAWAGTRLKVIGNGGHAEVIINAGTAQRDRRTAPRAIGIVSLTLIGIPVAFALLLLAAYSLIFVSHWFR
jgi:hypothetical protein